MEQKGFVSHQRNGKAYTYYALIQRERTFSELAREFLDRVFDGAVEEYLVHGLQARDVTADEIERLEQLIADAKRHPRPKKRKRGPDR